MFTARHFTNARGSVPLATPRGDAEGATGVTSAFILIDIISPNTFGLGIAERLGGQSRATIFTTDGALRGVEGIPPAIEDGIVDTSSFSRVEEATPLEALRRKGNTRVPVDVATRIVGAISHGLVVAFVFCAGGGVDPFEPFAVVQILAVSLSVVDGAEIITANRLVGVPFAERIEDAVAIISSVLGCTILVVASRTSRVPVAGRRSWRGRACCVVTVVHASSGTTNTLDDGVVDGDITEERCVHDQAVFAGETLLKNFEVKVQTVEVGATVGVGAR